jgi:hypothetical protein
MTILSDILMFSAVVVAAAGAVLGATVLFIVMALSRGGHLIAARTGQGPVEVLLVRSNRPHRTARYVVRRAAPQLAWSRSLARVTLHD